MNLKRLYEICVALVFAMMSFDAFARVRGAAKFADQFPPWVWILLGIGNIGVSLIFFKIDTKNSVQMDKFEKTGIFDKEPSESEINRQKVKDIICGVIVFSLGSFFLSMGFS
jgi:hypothetical protein